MIKKILFVVLCTLSGFLGFAQTEEPTKIYFIRHAEVENDGSRNPKLSASGMERAGKWARIFSTEKIDLVYSTDLIRTQTTAKTISDENKIDTIVSYDPRTFELELFLEKVKGKTVLVVGHSNTNPAFVNALIGTQKFVQMAANDFGSLYVVTYFSKDKASASVFNL